MQVFRQIGLLTQRSLSGVFARSPRMVPASALHGTETIHLGGGELLACPNAGTLPMAEEALSKGLGFPSLALPPARVHVLKEARVCPRSRVVASADGRIVAESMSSDMLGHAEIDLAELRGEAIKLDGAVAVYQSPRRALFHAFVDHLPRAALLAQPAVSRAGHLTIVHDGELSEMEELLLRRLAGPDTELLPLAPGHAVIAERVFLPGFVTRPFAGALPSWYRRWIDAEASTLRSVPGLSGRRLFVDRPGGTRRVTNRAALEKVLDRHGIVTITPSTMSALECAAAFRDAEMVVGVTGGGMANLIFSRSTRVVELTPGERLLPHFYYLAASKGLPYHHLPPVRSGRNLSIIESFDADLTVDVDALDDLLESFRPVQPR